MPTGNIIKEVPIEKTFRLAQLEGIFDLPIEKKSRINLKVDLPIENFDWQVGLIVGPSGAGKSLVAKEFFSDAMPPGKMQTKFSMSSGRFFIIPPFSKVEKSRTP